MKKTENEMVEDMVQQLSESGYECHSRYGIWNPKKRKWEQTLRKEVKT